MNISVYILLIIISFSAPPVSNQSAVSIIYSPLSDELLKTCSHVRREIYAPQCLESLADDAEEEEEELEPESEEEEAEGEGEEEGGEADSNNNVEEEPSATNEDEVGDESVSGNVTAANVTAVVRSRRSVPLQNCQPLPVHIRLASERFHEIDDPTEVLRFAGSVWLQWNVSCQEYAALTPRKPNGLTVRLSENAYFVPTFQHKTARDNFAMDGDGFLTNFYAAYNDGTFTFHWQRYGVISVSCEFKYDLFPFDSQVCEVEFLLQVGIHGAHFVVNEEAARKDITNEMMPPGTQWNLLGVQAEVEEWKVITNHSLARFKLKFQRKPSYFLWSLMAPSCLFTALSLASFLLDPKFPDRAVFSITLLLALAFLQVDVLDKVPPKPERTFMSNYNDLSLLLVFGITFFNLLGCNLTRAYPKWAESQLNGCCKISQKRILDLAVFTLALSIFLAINAYAIWTAAATGFFR